MIGYAIGYGIVDNKLGIICIEYVIIECYVFVLQELLCFLF